MLGVNQTFKGILEAFGEHLYLKISYENFIIQKAIFAKYKMRKYYSKSYYFCFKKLGKFQVSLSFCPTPNAVYLSQSTPEEMTEVYELGSRLVIFGYFRFNLLFFLSGQRWRRICLEYATFAVFKIV